MEIVLTRAPPDCNHVIRQISLMQRNDHRDSNPYLREQYDRMGYSPVSQRHCAGPMPLELLAKEFMHAQTEAERGSRRFNVLTEQCIQPNSTPSDLRSVKRTKARAPGVFGLDCRLRYRCATFGNSLCNTSLNNSASAWQPSPVFWLRVGSRWTFLAYWFWL